MSEYPEVDRLDKIHQRHELELHALRDAADSIDTAARILREQHIVGGITSHTIVLLDEYRVAVADARGREREAATAVNAAWTAATGDTRQVWTS